MWKRMGRRDTVCSNLNPIPAGVLKNQDTIGGKGSIDPLNPMFDTQI